jgi:hypothetical protein
VRVKLSVHVCMPPNDSSTPILYGWSVGISHLSRTVQKLFECIDLAENSEFGVKLGGFPIPICKSISTSPSKDTVLVQTASFEPMSVQIG